MEPDSSLPHSQVSLLPLSRARLVHSMTPNNFLKIHFNVNHLHPGLSSGLLPSAFPSKTLCPPLLSAIHATFPSIQFFLLWSPYQYLVRNTDHGDSHYAVFPTLLLPRPSEGQTTSSASYTYFQTHFILRSFLNMGDRVSHPYKTTGKIIVLHISMFTFLGSKLEDNKIFHRLIASTPWVQSARFHLTRVRCNKQNT